MSLTVVLVSIPGLRLHDLGAMPRLKGLAKQGVSLPLRASFPALSASVQASMTTGVGPDRHGVVANRVFERETGRIVNASPGEVPTLCQTLRQHDPALTSAAWFCPVSTGVAADLVCRLRDEGGESVCETRPEELAETLREALGVYPPGGAEDAMVSLNQTAWMVDSLVQSAYAARPRFCHVRLPHLESAAEKFGPDSDETLRALAELDLGIGALVDGFTAASFRDVHWLIASEYCLTPVSTVGFPNAALQEAGYLTLADASCITEGGLKESRAVTLVDHQVAQVYVRDAVEIDAIADVLRNEPGVASVLTGDDRAKRGFNRPQLGEIVLLARPEAAFSEQVNREAVAIRGSHGLAPAVDAPSGVLVSSRDAAGLEGTDGLRDVDLHDLVLSLFGVPDSGRNRS